MEHWRMWEPEAQGLLGDAEPLWALFDALGTGARRAPILRRVALALGQHVAVERLEFSWQLEGEGGWRALQIACGGGVCTIQKEDVSVPDGARRFGVGEVWVCDEGRGWGFGLEGAVAELWLERAQPEVAWLPHVGKVFAAAQRHAGLLHRVARVSQRAHQENRRLREQLSLGEGDEAFVAVSPAMQKVLEQARKVARFDATVRLQGASGTGKERLARWIHQRSARSKRPFVAIHCGALPENLVESELFGHEKGAFTGAHRRHLGCFERAHRGTLLLDEIAELPLSTQVKLLRVLQEGCLFRVGGEQEIPVDVRVIAATHQPLERWVDEGRFRRDLFYRLDVFPIELPSLSERGQDLPGLVLQILEQLCGRLKAEVPLVEAGVVEQMASRPWPGNIRQLENVLERAVILWQGELSASFSEILGLQLPSKSPSDGFVASGTSAPVASLEAAVRGCIEAALEHSQGRIYGPHGAALLLGLKPSTLQSKMKKLGIHREDFVRARAQN